MDDQYFMVQLLAMKEMHTKITLRFHLAKVRRSKINLETVTTAGEDIQNGNTDHIVGTEKWQSHYGKQ